MTAIQTLSPTWLGTTDDVRGRRGLIADVALLVAATAVGFASFVGNGGYSPGAILLITVAIPAAVASVLWSKRQAVGRRSSAWMEGWLVVAIALQFAAIASWWPVYGGSVAAARRAAVPFYGLTAVAVLCAAGGALRLRLVERAWFPLLLVAHLLLGFTVVRAVPSPGIDVWYFEQGAADTLLSGRNPYDFRETRYLDLTDRPRGSPPVVYGKELEDANGRLLFGFPYPPASLFCTTAARWIAGDSRYAQAVALTVAGLLVGYCRPGRGPKLAAVLLLFTPMTWCLLSLGWTEPFVVLALAATVFCACRRIRWWLPVAFGLFLASKQYCVLATPLSFLLVPDFNWRSASDRKAWATLLVAAFAVAAAVTLPLAVWNVHAFWVSIYQVQKLAPFRWDAISYLVWGHRLNVAGHHLNTMRFGWVPFVAIWPLLLFGIFKARRSPAGFCAAAALVYLVFIATNKQAFPNYYFFVTGCLCCAVACTPWGADEAGPGTAIGSRDPAIVPAN
jgi:hypothetical protein